MSITQVQLTIRTLPELPTGAKYKCVFGDADPIEAAVTATGLSCPTPDLKSRPVLSSTALAPIKDHILVPLSVSFFFVLFFLFLILRRVCVYVGLSPCEPSRYHVAFTEFYRLDSRSHAAIRFLLASFFTTEYDRMSPSGRFGRYRPLSTRFSRQWTRFSRRTIPTLSDVRPVTSDVI